MLVLLLSKQTEPVHSQRTCCIILNQFLLIKLSLLWESHPTRGSQTSEKDSNRVGEIGLEEHAQQAASKNPQP
jgi:hypothetical protein